MVWRDMRARGGPEREWASPGHVIDWQRARRDVRTRRRRSRLGPNLTGDGEPERLRGAAVSRAYFEALGVQPCMGRCFTPEEDLARRATDGGHQSRAVGATIRPAPDIVGRTVSLDGQPTTVVGVMPASFRPP